MTENRNTASARKPRRPTWREVRERVERENRIDRALRDGWTEIILLMAEHRVFAPDLFIVSPSELPYNALLDGCRLTDAFLRAARNAMRKMLRQARSAEEGRLI